MPGVLVKAAPLMEYWLAVAPETDTVQPLGLVPVTVTELDWVVTLRATFVFGVKTKALGATELPLLRLREVEAHHVDLDAGYGYADVPAPIQLSFLDQIPGRFGPTRAYRPEEFAEIAAEAENTRRQADLQRYLQVDPRLVAQQQVDAARSAAESARVALDTARKRVAAAESGVTEAQATVTQREAAVASARTAPQQIASAQSQVSSAQAGVEQAKAAVDAAQLDLSYTTISAPVAGRVSRKSVQPGQYMQVGQSMLAVVQPDVWVVANFKETQITHMHVGQDVDISVDAYPGQDFHARISSIQGGTGARFSLLPPENATGNYVKVVQRIPVKIVFEKGQDREHILRPSMSVVPAVRVK